MVYHAVIDSFPPQFQDPLMSRYAFPVLAMSHITPLPLQMEYVRSQIGGRVTFVSISMAFFSIHQWIIGCVILILCSVGIWSTFGSWKTYKANYDRAEAQGDKEVL
jgi:hypothetical protein